MRANRVSIGRIGANLCLLLVSCVAGLSLCEFSLRILYPKYRHAAEARFRQDAMRIWARTADSRDWMSHQDTYRSHPFHHNNLALRQHRNFNEADLAAAINIGFFGDSFVENIFMDAPYSFTEPLDFLLNQGEERFNVLNFGVHGYGPGQSFLHYENLHWAKNLDHVFFVYCVNDLPDLWINDLFRSEAGGLVRNRPPRSAWWVPFMSRFRIIYLLLDSRTSLSSYVEEMSANQERTSLLHLKNRSRTRASLRGDISKKDLKNSADIFQRLIRKWKYLVETNGGTFHLVTLPDRPTVPEIASVIVEEDVRAISLYDCFGDHDATHSRQPWEDSPYKFKNDYHWNEAGNYMAAVCLYRFLEEEADLTRLSEEKIGKILSQYYSAFASWVPEKHRREEGRRAASPQTLASIREKYQAFPESDPFKEKEKNWRPAQSRLLIDSELDIYLDGRSLIYVKANCNLANIQEQDRFFLHVFPFDKNDLLQDSVRHGFENLDFGLGNSFPATIFKIGESCGIRARLPDYPIHRIRTGQFVPGKGHTWEEEVFIDPRPLEHG